ncbi:hypothetical protein F5Y14DRAFT_65751 [Nemania sp. NC0429]|nr:hypothetical protein F5Y14DRAFT_65751 [Nemania sp. NC0429]
MERVVGGTGAAVLSSLWSLVRWITFFCKLASLAFVLPIIGLIAFDFALWLWRLYRPPIAADPPNSSRLPRDRVQRPSPNPAVASSTVVEVGATPQAAERRVAYEHTDR